MLGNTGSGAPQQFATATPVRLSGNEYDDVQPQVAYAQPVNAVPYQAQPAPQPAPYTPYGQSYNTQNLYAQSQQAYVAQPMQQPVAPVYVARAPGQNNMDRYKYEAEIERQRRINAERHAQNVEQNIYYEQRRRQQEQEEACCCLALSALCCAAFLAAN